MRELDVQAGIGEYGCLLLGANDGADSSDQPLRKGRASGPDSLRYTTVYNQSNAHIVSVEQDPSSSRFGLPTAYELQQEHGPSLKVHWTRVIHMVEGGMVLWRAPRLQRVFNRLMDLEKILAGGGESAWRLLVPAFLASTKDDYELDPDNTELQVAGIEDRVPLGSNPRPEGSFADCISIATQTFLNLGLSN